MKREEIKGEVLALDVRFCMPTDKDKSTLLWVKVDKALKPHTKLTIIVEEEDD
jgi:hypothetical protein